MDPETKPIWDKVNHWKVELDALKSILNKTELIETVKWGGPVYTINGKNVIGIGGFKNYFTIWFFNGVFLKDEDKVLVNAQEGVTKSLRQWRFTSIEEINETLILQYIAEAISNEKAGKSTKPVKKKQIESPLFQKELTRDLELRTAFEQFSPYKKHEFLEYIESAKREETKISRIEKVKSMIVNHIGLHEKYK